MQCPRENTSIVYKWNCLLRAAEPCFTTYPCGNEIKVNFYPSRLFGQKATEITVIFRRKRMICIIRCMRRALRAYTTEMKKPASCVFGVTMRHKYYWIYGLRTISMEQKKIMTTKPKKSKFYKLLRMTSNFWHVVKEDLTSLFLKF